VSVWLSVKRRCYAVRPSVCLSQEWLDYKLIWNPDLYNGVDRLYVPAEKIWLPDIVLYNKYVNFISNCQLSSKITDKFKDLG